MKTIDLLNVIRDLREKGVKTLDAERLEAFIRDNQSKEVTSTEWDLKAAEFQHQARLAEYGAQQDVARRMFDAVIMFATSALKSALMINGGAAVAILAYLGNQHNPEPTILPWAMVSFAGGVLLSAVASGFSYLSQVCFTETKQITCGYVIRCAAVALVLCSYAAFALGSYFAFKEFH